MLKTVEELVRNLSIDDFPIRGTSPDTRRWQRRGNTQSFIRRRTAWIRNSLQRFRTFNFDGRDRFAKDISTKSKP